MGEMNRAVAAFDAGVLLADVRAVVRGAMRHSSTDLRMGADPLR
jgi:hypothetical protein